MAWKVKAGDRLRVQLCDKKETVTEGTLLGLKAKSPLGLEVPKIRLKSRKIVYGYECWWLPLKTALKMEKKAGLEVRGGRFHKVKS